MRLTGIVLAAGAGTRAGGPKARRAGWLDAAVEALTESGCDPVLVVLGAAIDVPIPAPATAVVAEDWAEGMSASLRAGLRSASGDAALVTLVDLPSMPATVARRVAAQCDAAAETGSNPRAVLAQAVFDGRPGHPVLLGAEHWAGVMADVAGDAGARRYLVAHGVTEVECGDLWDGRDVDGPAPDQRR
jgi:CTP:molybdopterin cytidylyltransferase MocA